MGSQLSLMLDCLTEKTKHSKKTHSEFYIVGSQRRSHTLRLHLTPLSDEKFDNNHNYLSVGKHVKLAIDIITYFITPLQ